MRAERERDGRSRGESPRSKRTSSETPISVSFVSRRRCTCRSVQIGATFRFRDEETSFARSRATFASPPSIGHFQSAEQIDYRVERRRCSLACIAVYRVAVGFTSRRISKGPRSAFHSFQALLYSTAVTARNVAARQFDKASFSIKERSIFTVGLPLVLSFKI